jgi:hypothetical protein
VRKIIVLVSEAAVESMGARFSRGPGAPSRNATSAAAPSATNRATDVPQHHSKQALRVKDKPHRNSHAIAGSLSLALDLPLQPWHGHCICVCP